MTYAISEKLLSNCFGRSPLSEEYMNLATDDLIRLEYFNSVLRIKYSYFSFVILKGSYSFLHTTENLVLFLLYFRKYIQRSIAVEVCCLICDKFLR